LINESVAVGQQVLWFSTLVSKAANLPAIQAALGKVNAVQVRVVEMGQGQKQSRFVAWTFQSEQAGKNWFS